MTHALALQCRDCGAEYPLSVCKYRCGACQGYLTVKYDYIQMAKELGQVDPGVAVMPSPLRRWLPFLPIERDELIDAVSLGERETPLLASPHLAQTIGLDHVWIKNESCFPTGSLKDRSMPLVVLKALEYGYKKVAIVSSGNAAASLAAYAARAGLQAIVFVRAEASPAKLAKINLYGPLLIRVAAHLADVGQLFTELVEEFGWFDCDGMINPFRCEGKKTCAFEVACQLRWKSPDWVFIPTSTGNGMVAAHMGFRELKVLGLLDKVPRLVGVQLEACPPIARAFASGAETISPLKPARSISDTLLNGNPEAGALVLRAARDTGGTVIAVSDDEMLQAQRALAAQAGVFAEPAGAVGFAAAAKLRKAGVLRREDSVVCLVTGHGLNQPDAVAATMPLPDPIAPTTADIRNFILGHAGER